MTSFGPTFTQEWREAILLDPDGHRVFIYHAGENRLDPPWRVDRDTGVGQ